MAEWDIGTCHTCMHSQIAFPEQLGPVFYTNIVAKVQTFLIIGPTEWIRSNFETDINYCEARNKMSNPRLLLKGQTNERKRNNNMITEIGSCATSGQCIE